jgi:hypothetical protein
LGRLGFGWVERGREWWGRGKPWLELFSELGFWSSDRIGRLRSCIMWILESSGSSSHSLLCGRIKYLWPPRVSQMSFFLCRLYSAVIIHTHWFLISMRLFGCVCVFVLTDGTLLRSLQFP